MPEPATLLKQRLAQVFSCEYCKIFKNTYFEEQLRATVSFLRGFSLTVLIKFTPMNKRTSDIQEKHKNVPTFIPNVQ